MELFHPRSFCYEIINAFYSTSLSYHLPQNATHSYFLINLMQCNITISCLMIQQLAQTPKKNSYEQLLRVALIAFGDRWDSNPQPSHLTILRPQSILWWSQNPSKLWDRFFLVLIPEPWWSHKLTQSFGSSYSYGRLQQHDSQAFVTASFLVIAEISASSWSAQLWYLENKDQAKVLRMLFWNCDIGCTPYRCSPWDQHQLNNPICQPMPAAQRVPKYLNGNSSPN